MRVFFSAIALAGVVATGAASASTITYTASGTASGTIGQTSFSNDSYSITATGDTATAGLCQGPGTIPGCNVVLTSNMQISIGGVGTYTVTSPSAFFDNDNAGIIGFLEAPSGGSVNFYFYGVGAPAFSTYDATSALGPLSFFALTEGIVPGNSYAIDTDGGLLTFGAGASPGTFQAVLGSAVPEPGAWLTMTFGLLLIGASARARTAARRRATTPA